MGQIFIKKKLTYDEISIRIGQALMNANYDIYGHVTFCMPQEFKRYIDEFRYWNEIKIILDNQGYTKRGASYIKSILLKNRQLCNCAYYFPYIYDTICEQNLCEKCNNTGFIYTYQCIRKTYTFFTHRSKQYICIRK
jgi:hypothetical protein